MRSSLFQLFAVICICLPLLLRGQMNDTGARSLSLKFADYISNNRFEDIFIHCDRETYVAGDHILLKAYLFDRDSLVLSGTGTFVYVELINPFHKPVAQVKVLIENGKGSSVISVPDTVLNGQYMLRAYTNRMKNYMPYGCFMKDLIIINPFSNHYADLNFKPTGSNENPFLVSFWPEGGRLIAGISSRIGIHVSDRFGNPALFRGFIIDKEGKIITTISADSTGLGLVEFVPQKGMAYTAVNEKDNKSFSLPDVFEDGISIHVTETSEDSLKIVLIKGAGQHPEYSFAEVIIRSSGKIIFRKNQNLEDKQMTFTLPPHILATGINDIAVFDGSGKLAAERFIFRPEKRIEKEISPPQMQYGKREKIRFEIAAGEKGHISPQCNLSVSIEPISPGKSILTMNDHLVFGSEYRVANISHDIARLFFGSPPDKKEILLLGLIDNLIDWNKISDVRNQLAEFPAETGNQYLIVSGSHPFVSDEERYKPAFLTSPGKVPELFYSLPDAGNRYRFIINYGEEEKDIIIQLPDSASKTGYIVESPFYPGYISTDFQPDTTRKVIPDHFKMLARNFQVMKIYDIPDIRLMKKERLPVNPKIRFYGKPDQELIMKNYISLPTMQEVFLELIPGVIIRKNNGVARLHIIDPLTNSTIEGEPLMMIDGVRIDVPAVMLSLNPDKVEKIDIIAGEYLVGDLIFPGIINAITKTGDLSEVTLPRNSFRIKYRQSDPPAEYVTPDYSETAGISKRIPDFRNTIFWTYDLKTANDGIVIFEFNTSDISSDYLINVAGTDGSGKPVSYKGGFSVK